MMAVRDTAPANAWSGVWVSECVLFNFSVLLACWVRGKTLQSTEKLDISEFILSTFLKCPTLPLLETAVCSPLSYKPVHVSPWRDLTGGVPRNEVALTLRYTLI